MAPLTPEEARKLERKFEKLLWSDTNEATAKGCGRLPIWRKWLGDPLLRGVGACIKAIMLPGYPSGFTALWENDLIHTTAEARVLEWPWCQLFIHRSDVLRAAQKRLRDVNHHELTHCPCLDHLEQ